MKNATPIVVARLVTLIAAAFLLFIMLVLKLVMPDKLAWIIVFIVPVILGVALYIINVYSLERFIYRKIKLVYKTIYDTKLSAQEKPVKSDLKSNVIQDVENEVINWQQNNLKEIRKQKKLEKYRKEFLGNVFHELKTPIFNIQGYLETLIEGGIEDENINMKFLQKARKNVKRMTEIVDDLQMISNLEDGSFSLNEEKFDIHRLASDVMDSAEIRARKKDIDLEFKEGCDRSFMVIADRELVQQVMNNLITNSIKYGKENGHTHVGLYDMNENILVEISDNGIGIDPKHLPRIFERFYRVDKDRSREQGGSGLGLSIVKHIIEAHDQTVNVRSAQGLGTTFGFTLKKAR
ncbi:MAG TPA: ATP-binding protein [Bacteroidales bacterium]|mgnify:CR=1 FL=1|nr:ATP-binding protein [Bacteroidales bacterium]HRX97633.1 ATP-binding protein [Bacteroidales bacterium]